MQAADDISDIMPPEELANVDQEAFSAPGTWALSNTEAHAVLNNYQSIRVASNPGYQLPAAVKKTKDYTEKFRPIENEESTRAVRAKFGQGAIKQFEYALLVNLMPETAEEAYALIPSLKDPNRFTDEALEELLQEMLQYKEFQ